MDSLEEKLAQAIQEVSEEREKAGHLGQQKWQSVAFHKDMSGISGVKDFKMTALFGEPKSQKVKDADDKIEEMKAVNEAAFVKENCDILRYFWYANSRMFSPMFQCSILLYALMYFGWILLS